MTESSDAEPVFPENSVEMYLSGGLRWVEARLMARFSPPLRREEVERHLLESIASFPDARVEVYLPILIERAAADRLQEAVHRLPRVEPPSPINGACRRSTGGDLR